MDYKNLDPNIFKKGYIFKAILGPTNTGKTYYALDRMLSYKSGIFGFPLRLLARENYDKAIIRIGKEKVALITGEEKIIPKEPKFYFCTVESMPITKIVEFVAIDEIQLVSDFERGHIFTDRMLTLRGSYETLFLGSSTIEKILRTIFPKITIDYRERLSRLSYSKKKNISKLKPRSAIIAFNLNDIYLIAETLRSQKGGAAIVLGALSPRTRNSQVEMYEKQNVNYLVATDAIGMGLNLNIEHVAFSSLKKYDGKFHRKLHLSEIGQIAGRAGRFKKDGTFGLTKNAYDLDPASIESIENHNFDPIEKIYWRNSNLDFSSISSIINSLNQNPTTEVFIKKKNAEDEKSFRFLSDSLDVKKYLNDSYNIKILWNVCRIPDFQKLMTESYSEFLKSIFINLMLNNNFLPDKWIEENVKRLNNINGEIDILSKRIEHIRTWTYISNQGEWIKNKSYWQEITRNIEDKLSDELHNKLKNRFVDQEGNFFVDKIKKGNNLNVEFKDNKLIEIEGSKIGSIEGFNLKLSKHGKLNNSNLVNSNAKKSILKMMPERIKSLINAPDEAFNFGNIHEIFMNSQIYIYWGEDVVAYLEKSDCVFLPNISVLNSDLLDSYNRDKILRRIKQWLTAKISYFLKPINKNTNDISNFPIVRSIAYTLFHDLGCTEKKDFVNFTKELSNEEKIDLKKLGIRTGIQFYYFPNFMKKDSIELRSLLWKNYNGFERKINYPLPANGRVYFTTISNLPKSYWQAIGYIKIKNIALRVDIFERLFFMVRQKYRFGTFIQHSDLMNLVGCDSIVLKEILLYLNYDSVKMGNDQLIFSQNQNRKNIKPNFSKEKKNNLLKKGGKEKKQKTSFGALGAYFNK